MPRNQTHPNHAEHGRSRDDYDIEILLIADRGDYVVVTARTGGRGKQSGVEVEVNLLFVFSVRDGKIVELKIFTREGQALEAAGLRE